MKRQYANLFYIALHKNVQSVNGNQIIFSGDNNLELILAENNLDLIEKQSVAGANDYFKQDSKAITLSVPAATREKYRNSKVVMQLKTTQGELFTWGSEDLPVRCKIDSKLNGDQWTFTRKAPNPIIT